MRNGRTNSSTYLRGYGRQIERYLLFATKTRSATMMLARDSQRDTIGDRDSPAFEFCVSVDVAQVVACAHEIESHSVP